MGMMLVVYILYFFWYKCLGEFYYRNILFLFFFRIKDVWGKFEIRRVEFKFLFYNLIR